MGKRERLHLVMEGKNEYSIYLTNFCNLEARHLYNVHSHAYLGASLDFYTTVISKVITPLPPPGKLKSSVMVRGRNMEKKTTWQIMLKLVSKRLSCVQDSPILIMYSGLF